MGSLNLSRVALNGCVALLLAGCGGPQPPIGSSGVNGQAPTGTTEIAPVTVNLGVKAMAVSDELGGVTIFNSAGKITRKLSTPKAYGLAYDNVGHLYVAENGAVAEYKSDSSSHPDYAYTKGLGLVVGVATDSATNVYAVSLLQNTVIEYAQHGHAIVNQCHFGDAAYVRSIAVDTSRGAVFISSTPVSSNPFGAVAHFPHGLSGCHGGGSLHVKFRYPTGLAIDSRTRDLLVSDLDILKPPYTRIRRELQNLGGSSITLNNDTTNRLLFLVSGHRCSSGGCVDIVHYPSGKVYTQITKGLTYASGVAVR